MDELITVLKETNRLLAEHLPQSQINLSVVISLLALAAAIGIPVYIACRQNKITLFEKRFTAYSILLKLNAFAGMMSQDDCSFKPEIIAATGKDLHQEIIRRKLEILHNFESMFYAGPKYPNPVNVSRATLSTVRALELSIHALPMLYSKQLPNKGRDANDEITQIFESFAEFMSAMATPTNLVNDQHRTDFVSKTNAFFDKYADIFEDDIRL